MKNIVLDTNVLLSFHFQDADKNQQKAINHLVMEIRKGIVSGHISLITFYQLLHFIDRSLRSPKEAAKRGYTYLEFLAILPFEPSTLAEQDYRDWPDYEDGLQHACAMSASADIIVTTNLHDFYASNIPVVDPLNFVLEYLV